MLEGSDTGATSIGTPSSVKHISDSATMSEVSSNEKSKLSNVQLSLSPEELSTSTDNRSAPAELNMMFAWCGPTVLKLFAEKNEMISEKLINLRPGRARTSRPQKPAQTLHFSDSTTAHVQRSSQPWKSTIMLLN